MRCKLNSKLFFLSLLFLLTACSDFLEVDPYAYLTKGDIKTPKDVNLVLTGAYNSLTDEGLYKESMYLFNEVRSDNAWCDQSAFYANLFRIEFYMFNITSLNTGVKNYWQHHWRAIGRCNLVIQTSLDLNPEKNDVLKSYIAEARFLRALYMFNLTRAFGEIPVVKELATSIVEVNEHTLRPLSDVYQFITDDIEAAIEELPYKPRELGRTSKAAAMALKGKIYLTMTGYPYNDPSRNPNGLDATSCYTTAMEALSELTSDDPITTASTNYALKLLPSYQELYNSQNKGNAEDLFSVQYLSGTGIGLGSPYPKVMGPKDYQLNIPNSGEGQCVPTRDLMDAYTHSTTMDPFNTVEVASNTDIRDGRGITPPASAANTAFGQGYTITATVKGKGANANYFTGKYMSKGSSINRDADDNWYVLRLADVLLMQAEILWEQGHYDESINKLNFLIKRANLTIGSDAYKLPLYIASNYNKEEGRKLIQDERRKELAFEGHRWFDLVRTNRYYDDSSATNRTVNLMNKFFQKNYSNYLNGITDKYAIIDELVYISEDDLIYKIPPLEVSLNPGLEK